MIFGQKIGKACNFKIYNMMRFLIKLPIFKRLIPSLYKIYLYFTQNYFHNIKVKNIIYNLDLRHLIDRRFFFHREYEKELFFPLKNCIDKYKINIFLDIGSCWGIYSLRLSSVENLKIFSFDPILKNIDRLKKSILDNDIKNIKIFHTAIGSFKGTIELGATEDFSPNYKINETNSVIKEKCSIDTVDNLVFFKNENIAIKIDTEGHEFDVLSGADKLLRNNNCYCQIEVSSGDHEKIFNYFTERNYNLISVNKKNKLDYIFSNFIDEKIIL